jgi:hypothetical protein
VKYSIFIVQWNTPCGAITFIKVSRNETPFLKIFFSEDTSRNLFQPSRLRIISSPVFRLFHVASLLIEYQSDGRIAGCLLLQNSRFINKTGWSCKYINHSYNESTVVRRTIALCAPAECTALRGLVVALICQWLAKARNWIHLMH